MKTFWVAIVPALLFFAQARAADEPLSRVRVSHDNAAALAHELRAEGFDVLEGSITRMSLELVVSPAEKELLSGRGLRLELLEIGRPLRDIIDVRRGSVPADYQDLTSILDTMQAAADNFPGICQLVDLTAGLGTSATVEGRHLFAVKISDNVGTREDEPALLVVSAHHCREIVTPVAALHALEQLTTLYGSDPDITAAVNENEIWIAPVWNPDGYEHVFNAENLWRKNRRVFPDGIGVDLNRNYPFGWSGACSGSGVTTSETFKGPAPASEAETQTMIAFTEAFRFAKVIDYHSSGREALWGYSCSFHPLAAFFQAQAIILATESGYGGSNRPPTAEGEHYEWQIHQFGAFSFLVEIHTTFQPSYQSAQAEAATVWPGILWMLERPLPLGGHVTDALSGEPLAATISFPDINFTNGEQHGSGGPFGRYHAFLPAGGYDATFEASGYLSQTHSVQINANAATVLNVALVPETCIGDVNSDRELDLLDYVTVIDDFGLGAGITDINGDGLVDGADLLDILPFWHICP